MKVFEHVSPASPSQAMTNFVLIHGAYQGRLDLETGRRALRPGSSRAAPSLDGCAERKGCPAPASPPRRTPTKSPACCSDDLKGRRFLVGTSTGGMVMARTASWRARSRGGWCSPTPGAARRRGAADIVKNWPTAVDTASSVPARRATFRDPLFADLEPALGAMDARSLHRTRSASCARRSRSWNASGTSHGMPR